MNQEKDDNILLIVAARMARQEGLRGLHDLCEIPQRVVGLRTLREQTELAGEYLLREAGKVHRGYDALRTKLGKAEAEVARLNEQVQELKGRLQLVAELNDVQATLHAEAEKQVRPLAAENAHMKLSIQCHAAGFSVCEACGEENTCGNDDVCRAIDETPATDATLNEVRADVMEQAAEEVDQWVGNDLLAKELRRKADLIRKGELQL